jgi:hypothetical protein
MEARTLKVLRGSIAKWRRVAAGAEDRGVDDCRLCSEFIYIGCRGCPAGKLEECCGGHYRAWVQHFKDSHHCGMPRRKIVPGCPECIRLATNVLNYLKGLMPKEG